MRECKKEVSMIWVFKNKENSHRKTAVSTVSEFVRIQLFDVMPIEY